MKLPAEGTLRRIATFLATFGIGVATYIAIADSGGGSPVRLAGGSGCETVANSAYAHLLGVNVAAFGIAGYVLLLAVSLLRGDGARMAGFGLS
ncbi:MAG TPA: vitamin K epoxide reductase family protein, partial [Solirubrobacterales bacterium]|nr:vitamin K epoxide reductase family protein [Solirubrobacterales bacterium]